MYIFLSFGIGIVDFDFPFSTKLLRPSNSTHLHQYCFQHRENCNYMLQVIGWRIFHSIITIKINSSPIISIWTGIICCITYTCIISRVKSKSIVTICSTICTLGCRNSIIFFCKIFCQDF